jgi:hypothetical protein
LIYPISSYGDVDCRYPISFLIIDGMHRMAMALRRRYSGSKQRIIRVCSVSLLEVSSTSKLPSGKHVVASTFHCFFLSTLGYKNTHDLPLPQPAMVSPLFSGSPVPSSSFCVPSWRPISSAAHPEAIDENGTPESRLRVLLCIIGLYFPHGAQRLISTFTFHAIISPSVPSSIVLCPR